MLAAFGSGMAAHPGVDASVKLAAGLKAALQIWLRRRRAERRRIALAAWDLEERYGPAARHIARNSARAPIGREGRRFWRQVARRLPAG